MKVLGIEGTAHTAGIGIVDGRNILKDLRRTYTSKEGGIMPREAAEFISKAYVELLKELSGELKGIEAIAYSAAPGLGPCLRIASALARYLALALDLPLIPVNHAIAHLEVAEIFFDLKDPVFLYVSGGNTQVIVKDPSGYKILGETLDIAAGNAIDKLARALGLGHPGGPKLEKLARSAKKFIEMPYVVKGMDMSFSGILTYAKNLIGREAPEDIAYSFLEHVFAMLIEVGERALAGTGRDEIVVVGGVAANKRFREMLKTMAEERGARYYLVPVEYAGDNGIMIAYTGKKRLEAGFFMKGEERIYAGYMQRARVDVDTPELIAKFLSRRP